MKFLTWNIRWGGENRVDAILAALLEHNADVIVLTEFRQNTAGAKIRAGLSEAGWPHQTESDVPSRQLGIFIGSKTPIDNVGPLFPDGSEPYRVHRTDIGEMTIVGAYLPYDKSGREVWDDFLTAIPTLADRSALLMGDLNAG